MNLLCEVGVIPMEVGVIPMEVGVVPMEVGVVFFGFVLGVIQPCWDLHLDLVWGRQHR